MTVSARDFIHPEDHAALENLKSIPLFNSCVEMFMKVVSEQLLHGMNMAQKIRLGPDQLPDIYRYLPPVCTTFGIEKPEFYLEMNPSPNAYTFGESRIFITVTSGLVDCMEEDEMQAIIAHECGHIVCQHVLYHTMADMLIKFGSSIFGPLAMVSKGIALALLYWYRRSELSADRAGAIFMQGPNSMVDTMIRLAGGPKAITEKVNLDAYIKQAESYDRLQESNWDKVLQGIAIMEHDHPFLAVRTREIRDWCASEQFQKLMLGAENQTSTTVCLRCSKPIDAKWKFCQSCGCQLNASPTTALQGVTT